MLANALSDAAALGFIPEESRKIAVTMRHKIKKNWQSHFKKSGLTASDIARLAACLAACEEETG